MITAIKVHFHCLFRLFAKQSHRMCWQGLFRIFCECGYGHPEGKTYADLVRELR